MPRAAVRRCSSAKSGAPAALLATISPSRMADRAACRAARSDVGKARGEVMPVAAEDCHVGANLVGLHAVAVELHLVQPVGPAGDFFGGDRTAGLDKTERCAQCGHEPAPTRDAMRAAISTRRRSTLRACSCISGKAMASPERAWATASPPRIAELQQVSALRQRVSPAPSATASWRCSPAPPPQFSPCCLSAPACVLT